MSLLGIAESFHRSFTGYESARGEYVVTGVESNGKVAGKARTILEAATAEHWLKHFQGKHGEPGLGVIPIRRDDTCYWGAIDIDDRTIDHQALEAACGTLPVIIARSKSGGAHVYVFFSEPIPASTVQSKLTEWAAMLGVGGCEIFPKQTHRASERDVGNWLNMCYAGGDNGERRMMRGGKWLTLEEAVALIASVTITREQFEGIRLTLKKGDDGAELFADGPPCLQYLATVGFPKGTRNMGLYNVAVYFKKKNPDGYADDVAKYNLRHMEEPLSQGEVEQTRKSVSKKDYGYRCKEAPINAHCNRKVCLSRKYGVGNGGGHDGGAKVQIGSLTKIETDPPVWVLDIEGARIETDTETLLSQRKFQQMCVEKLHKCPPTINASRWNNIIHALLQNLDVQPAPPDAGVTGQFMVLLDQFFTDRPLTKHKDEIIVGRCYHNAEKHEIWFRSNDLINYLKQNHFQHKSVNQVWAILRKLGAGNARIRLKTRFQNIWIMPDSFSSRLEGEDNKLPIPGAITDEATLPEG